MLIRLANETDLFFGEAVHRKNVVSGESRGHVGQTSRLSEESRDGCRGSGADVNTGGNLARRTVTGPNIAHKHRLLKQQQTLASAPNAEPRDHDTANTPRISRVTKKPSGIKNQDGTAHSNRKSVHYGEIKKTHF